MDQDQNELEFDLSSLNVCVAMPVYRGVVPVDTMVGFLDITQKLAKIGIPLSMMYERENALIDLARNRLVRNFLEQTEANKLVFVDDDIVFRWKDFERLLCWSTKYPVVAGTYPTRTWPTKFFIDPGEKLQFTEDGLLRVHSCGFGFVIIDRSVFEELKPHTDLYIDQHGEPTQQYFKIGIFNNRYMGEDIYFYNTLKKINKEVVIDPMIDLKHIGTHVFESNFAEGLNDLIPKLKGDK